MARKKGSKNNKKVGRPKQDKVKRLEKKINKLEDDIVNREPTETAEVCLYTLRAFGTLLTSAALVGLGYSIKQMIPITCTNCLCMSEFFAALFLIVGGVGVGVSFVIMFLMLIGTWLVED